MKKKAMRRRKGRVVDPELMAYQRQVRRDTERFTKLKTGSKILNVISKKVGVFEGLIQRNHPFLKVALTNKNGQVRRTVWDVNNVSTKPSKK